MKDSQEKSSHEIMVIEDDMNLAELLKSSPPDAIVLDILLEEGEMDGRLILRELKGSADLNEIPVFVSTALDEREKG